MSTRPEDPCPDCGAPLPADAPLGLCPACLVAGALAGAGDDAGEETVAESGDADAGGDAIPGYCLLRRLGEGGFAVVWEAEQLAPVRRRVALKILKQERVSPRLLARFEAERQALAMMDHPHIAKIFDAGETASGVPWVAMELIDGEPVTRYAVSRGLSAAERFALFRPVCEAVQHAHWKGVIHRDLKPSNILVAEIDGHPVPKVIDFGIAKALDVPLTDRTLFTEWHQIVGTPGYMSPEQAGLDGAPVDGRSDLYSLGVILYELVSGRQPFAAGEGTSLLEVLRRVREDEPPRLSEGNPALRGEPEWVVRRAMAKDPADRYESAGALAREIGRLLEHRPVEAGPPSAGYLAAKFMRRHRVFVTAAAVTLAALLTGTFVSTMQYLRASALGEELAESERALRVGFRNADYRMALQLCERRRSADAIAYLCRALRTDPDHAASASVLLSILAHESFPKPVHDPLPYPEGIARVRLPVVFEADGAVVAVGDPPGAETTEPSESLLVALAGTDEWTNQPTGLEAPVSFLGAASREGWFVVAAGASWELRSLRDPGTTTIRGESVDGTPITAMALDLKSRILVCGNAGGSLFSWDLDTGALRDQVALGAGSVTRIAIGRDGTLAAYGTSRGRVGTWGLVLGQENGTTGLHGEAITALALSANGNLLVSGDAGGVMRIGRGRAMVSVAAPVYHTSEVGAVVICPRHQRIASGSGDGFVRIWDSARERLAAAPAFQQGAIENLTLSADPGQVLSLGRDGSIRIVDLLSGNGEALPGAGKSSGMAVSAGRRWLATVSDESRALAVYDLAHRPAVMQLSRIGDRWDGKRVPAPKSDSIGWSASISPPHQVRVTRPDGTIWSLQTVDPVGSVVFDDGEPPRLAVLSGTGRLQLWDAASGDALSHSIRLGEAAEKVRFTDREDRIELDLVSGERGELCLPPRQLHLPHWFPGFAGKVGGKVLDGNGIPRHPGRATLADLAALIPADAGVDGRDSMAADYAKWLTAGGEARTLAPGDWLTLEDYVSRLLASGSPADLREVLRLDPVNEEAVRLLRGR